MLLQKLLSLWRRLEPRTSQSSLVVRIESRHPEENQQSTVSIPSSPVPRCLDNTNSVLPIVLRKPCLLFSRPDLTATKMRLILEFPRHLSRPKVLRFPRSYVPSGRNHCKPVATFACRPIR